MWGLPTILLIIGVGLFFTFKLKFIQFRQLGHGFHLLFSNKSGKGEITSFQALCVALSSCMGTGNIVGVAIAITTGGVGALFWMVVAALLNMATMYSEATMAVKFRKVSKDGVVTGGPFYYIEHATKNKILSIIFAIATILACTFGIGSLSQIGSITSSVNNMTKGTAALTVFGNEISIIALAVSIIAVISAGVILLGGIKSIAKIVSKIVPILTVLYLICGLLIIALNITSLPGALYEIVTEAFSFRAVSGGFLGTTLMLALRNGFARGVFSNEGGMGSNAIAAAAAKCKHPSEQGLVSMIGVFIDTC